MFESHLISIKKYIVSSHALVILFVFGILASLLYMKGVFNKTEIVNDSLAQATYNPNLAKSFTISGQVLGANSNGEPPTPMEAVIGDDGSFVPINDLGKVLGASSRTAEAVAFYGKSISTTSASLNEYLNQLEIIEARHVEPATLETALSNQDLATLVKARDRFQGLINEMQGMTIPDAALKYHQLKLQQYSAAMVILGNFDNLEANSEVVSKALIEFMQTEQDQTTELLSLQGVYHE
jgi:hypothetical protein